MSGDSGIGALLAQALADQQEKPPRQLALVGGDREAHTQSLLDAYGVLTRNSAFKPGDVIELKRGIETGDKLLPGEPCVVVELLADPIRPVGNGGIEDLGNTQAAHIYDLVFGHLTPDGAMVLHLSDTRFFQKADLT